MTREAGFRAVRRIGEGSEVERLREYLPGDDFRRIDWKATARLRSPQVRVFTEERERPVLFVVDQRTPMFFGSRLAMKSVAAAELAALATWRALDVGDRIGGIVFNEEEVVSLRPGRSPTQALRFFHDLERMNHRLADPEPLVGEVTLNAALQSASRMATHDHLVVLVTDLDGADDETAKLATRLCAHNDLLIVAVYDPLGAQLSGYPGMRATDRGRSWEIPPGKRFEDDFESIFAKTVEQWTTLFRSVQVPLFPLSCASPVIDQIHELLGQQK